MSLFEAPMNHLPDHYTLALLRDTPLRFKGDHLSYGYLSGRRLYICTSREIDLNANRIKESTDAFGKACIKVDGVIEHNPCKIPNFPKNFKRVYTITSYQAATYNNRITSLQDQRIELEAMRFSAIRAKAIRCGISSFFEHGFPFIIGLSDENRTANLVKWAHHIHASSWNNRSVLSEDLTPSRFAIVRRFQDLKFWSRSMKQTPPTSSTANSQYTYPNQYLAEQKQKEEYPHGCYRKSGPYPCNRRFKTATELRDHTVIAHL